MFCFSVYGLQEIYTIFSGKACKMLSRHSLLQPLLGGSMTRIESLLILYKEVLEGKIHAKSGTIAGTKNFAGYIDLPNGDKWVFAILINSAPGKAKHIQTVIQQYLLDVYRNNT